MYAKESKCSLGMAELLYLGHIINREGFSMDPEKIRAIIDWPTPETLTQLRGFVGLCAFYRRFISGFSQHAVPLTDLTKGAFVWTPLAQACFEKFKLLMTTCPILALPDFARPFELHCDANGEGIGVVIKHDRHPISFESRKLRGPERSFNIYDKEMLAIMHAMAKFRQYLIGSKFNVTTDHNSLKHFLGQRDLNERQQKWVSKLQSYDFDIAYVKGTQNVVANALSRRPHLSSISLITENWRHMIVAEYAKNPWASSIVDGTVQDDRYSLVDNLIIYKGRIFLVHVLR